MAPTVSFVEQSSVSFVTGNLFRLLVLTSAGRNPEFLDRSRRYTQAVFGAAAVINLFPAWGKLLVSQIVTLPMWMHLKACNRIAAPVIKQRLQAISGKVGETQSKARSTQGEAIYRPAAD